jgi:hypothetical protein
MALEQGHWGTGSCSAAKNNRSNCNGTGYDQLIGCNGTGAGATGAGATGAMAMGQWGATTIYRIAIILCAVLQRKASTIVVDETAQNMWTANIHDVVCSNKTCMMWSGILFRVSE